MDSRRATPIEREPGGDQSICQSLTDAQQQRLAAIMEKCLLRLERGEPIDIEALCERDPELADGIRHYLDGLMFVHEAAEAFVPSNRTSRQLPDESTTSPPGQLGNYRLLQEIGRGGMGVVYEAEDVLLHRRVALKVLPFAALLDQRQVIRFQNEARAAGQLHHPHIVPIFSVGVERGIHYFAMQFIEGRSLRTLIDELIPHQIGSKGAPTRVYPHSDPAVGMTKTHHASSQNDEGMPLRASHTAHSPDQRSATTVARAWSTTRGADPRLTTVAKDSTTNSSQAPDSIQAAARIAAEVADALEHAHSHGVIHRDIKPANLLLDAAGKTWVTDFGLARAPQETGVTLSGDVMGTIRYMSPEQAAGKTAFVDHRTDIYSLGITLYELLTLRPAFEATDRQAFLREIDSVEPIRPRQLNRQIPIDLENVVLKAIAKEPNARYATAGELAADLNRFLQGKPTLAKRPTLVDRAAKWTRRHSHLVAATLGVMTLLLTGTLWAFLLIVAEQNRTQQALHESQTKTTLVRDLLAQTIGAYDRIMQMNERLVALPGAETIRRDVLADALKHWEHVIQRTSDLQASDGPMNLDLAVAYMKAGEVTKQLGDLNQAQDYLNRSIDLFQQLRDADEDDPNIRAHQARAMNNRGLLLLQLGDTDGALADLDAAILEHTGQVHRGEGRHREKALDDLSCAYLNRAHLRSSLQQTEPARRDFVSAMNATDELLALAPDSRRYRQRQAVLHQNLAAAAALNQPKVAIDHCHKAQQINAQLIKEDPSDLATLRNLAISKNTLATYMHQQGQHAESLELHQQALEITKQLVARSPLVVAFRNDLGETHFLLGNLQLALEDPSAAEHSYQQSQLAFAAVVETSPDSANAHSNLGAALFNLGLTRRVQGQALAGKQLCAEGIQHQELAVSLAPQVDRYRTFLDDQNRQFASLFAEGH